MDAITAQVGAPEGHRQESVSAFARDRREEVRLLGY
jgi:hypothetical protein